MKINWIQKDFFISKSSKNDDLAQILQNEKNEFKTGLLKRFIRQF